MHERMDFDGNRRCSLRNRVLHRHDGCVDNLVAEAALVVPGGIKLDQHDDGRQDDQRDEDEEFSLIPKRSDRHHLPINDCGVGYNAAKSFLSWRISAAPSATQSIGWSATRTGMLVMSCSVSARPAIPAPPPAS